MLLSRRKFVLTGLVAAPAVVAIDRLMPISVGRDYLRASMVPEGAVYRHYADMSLWHKKNGVLHEMKLTDPISSIANLNHCGTTVLLYGDLIPLYGKGDQGPITAHLWARTPMNIETGYKNWVGA